jgi:predicted GNAT superfamily acetyltransferase
MLKIVLEAEVLLVKFDGTAEIADMDGHMINALEHNVLLAQRIGSEAAFLQVFDGTVKKPERGSKIAGIRQISLFIDFLKD